MHARRAIFAVEPWTLRVTEALGWVLAVFAAISVNIPDAVASPHLFKLKRKGNQLPADVHRCVPRGQK